MVPCSEERLPQHLFLSAVKNISTIILKYWKQVVNVNKWTNMAKNLVTTRKYMMLVFWKTWAQPLKICQYVLAIYELPQIRKKRLLHSTSLSTNEQSNWCLLLMILKTKPKQTKTKKSPSNTYRTVNNTDNICLSFWQNFDCFCPMLFSTLYLLSTNILASSSSFRNKHL